jgi:signal transduction histidine kinase
MVDDLFELSRIHSGTLQLSHDEITLDDLVSDVLASTEPLARERGVWLAGKAAGQLTVRADPRELSRALTNLLANAIRYTPPGGSVYVEARPEEEEALLTVSDGCGGIPEADLPYVFDLAWRGTDARSPAPDSGAGLGLAIVRGVVEAHRGSVGVVNTTGGCRFEMRLPACS